MHLLSSDLKQAILNVWRQSNDDLVVYYLKDDHHMLLKLIYLPYSDLCL